MQDHQDELSALLTSIHLATLLTDEASEQTAGPTDPHILTVRSRLVLAKAGLLVARENVERAQRIIDQGGEHLRLLVAR